MQHEALIAAAQATIARGEDATHLLESLAASLSDDERAAAARGPHEEDHVQRKATRKALKDTRAELRQLLAKVDTALARGSAAPSACSDRGSSKSEQQPATATLQLRPPILDPKAILPAHIIEGFRHEFRSQQRDKAAPAQPCSTSARQTDSSRALALSLEEFEESLGVRRPSPADAKVDFKRMTHGQSRQPFRSFPGAISGTCDEQVTSPGKRAVPGSRAAQSSLGELLAGDPALAS